MKKALTVKGVSCCQFVGLSLKLFKLLIQNFPFKVVL